MSTEAMRAEFEARWYARPGTPLLWREGEEPDAPYKDSGMNARWENWQETWQAATLAERERCAKACEAEHVGDSVDDDCHSNGDKAYNTALRHAAEAIRKGKMP